MRRYRFLLPLVVPVVLFVLVVASGMARNDEAIPGRAAAHSTIFEIAFNPLLGTVVYCGSGFWSGWLFRRDREVASAPTALRPGAALPPPPPPPPPRPSARGPRAF